MPFLFEVMALLGVHLGATFLFICYLMRKHW